MSRRWASISLQSVATDGTRVPVRIPPWVRCVYSVAGCTARTVPLVVRYTGTERVAERMRERLQRYGYSRVELELAPRKRPSKRPSNGGG